MGPLPESEGRAARSESRGRAALLPALFLALTAALAILLYRPYQRLPFDFVDFSEFLPILRDSSSVLSRMDGLAAYYASQGRANLVQYVLIDASWTAFGDWSPGWQWLRFATMLAVIGISYLVLRRLGSSSAAAVAGSSIFLVAPSAATGWIRLTMGEPVATLLLLSATLLVLGDAPRIRGWVRWWVLALLLGLMVLAKEVLLVAFVLPLAMSTLVTEYGTLGPPRIRSATRRLLALSAVIALLAAGWTLSVLLRAPSEAYASSFGQNLRSWDEAVAWWFATLLPFDPAGASRSIVGVALIGYVALIIAGWALRLRKREHAASIERTLLAVAVGFPLVGVLLYVPWPKHEVFYSIPFLVGSALLAALSLSAIERRGRSPAILAYTVWFSLLAIAATDAGAQARRVSTRQVIVRELVERLEQATAYVDTVYVASDAPIPQNWQKLGATIARYGKALNLRMPTVIDASCSDTRSLARLEGNAAVFFSSLCPNPTTEHPIVSRFHRLTLPTLRLTPDSLRVDLILPTRERPTDRSGQ